MIIISIDPGGTTGWCVAKLPEFTTTAGQCRNVVEVVDILDIYKPEIVVSEAFRLYPWRAKSLSWNNMPAAEVIGAVKTWCSKNGAKYCEQPASARKGIANDWLKSSGLWKVTRGKPHARDATRHLLYYCIVKGYISPKDLERSDAV